MKESKDFTLNDHRNKPFNLFESLGNNKFILLIFYPADFTPVCTKQLIDYNNNRAKFEEYGIYPVVINIGSVESHCYYAETFRLDFPHLSDHGKIVSRKYDEINSSGGNKRKLV
jgi:peroxiredoxin